MCPGKKDYVSVKNDKEDRVKMQKTLVAKKLQLLKGKLSQTTCE